MKQLDIFGNIIDDKKEDKYTSKINIPIYEPKNKKPHVMELYDMSKTLRLIRDIKNSSIEDEDKKFLTEAAKRHTIFNYSKIADYYANSSKEVQELMEKSALVIIDFKKSIELGYTKLSDNLLQTFLNEPTNE